MKNDSSTSLFKSFLSVKAMPDYPGTNVEDAWSKFRSLVMGSTVSAFGLRQRKQPDWFRESANVSIPAVEARHEARLQLKIQNTRAAETRLLTAKANVQRLVHAGLHDFCNKDQHRSAETLLRLVTSEGYTMALNPPQNHNQ